MPFVPDADVGTDDLTAEGCGACSCQTSRSELFSSVNPPLVDSGSSARKQKKRVPLSVPREQRVNALCMEKSVLHAFGQECGK